MATAMIEPVIVYISYRVNWLQLIVWRLLIVVNVV